MNIASSAGFSQAQLSALSSALASLGPEASGVRPFAPQLAIIAPEEGQLVSTPFAPHTLATPLDDLLSLIGIAAPGENTVLGNLLATVQELINSTVDLLRAPFAQPGSLLLSPHEPFRLDQLLDPRLEAELHALLGGNNAAVPKSLFERMKEVLTSSLQELQSSLPERMTNSSLRTAIEAGMVASATPALRIPQQTIQLDQPVGTIATSQGPTVTTAASQTRAKPLQPLEHRAVPYDISRANQEKATKSPLSKQTIRARLKQLLSILLRRVVEILESE